MSEPNESNHINFQDTTKETAELDLTSPGMIMRSGKKKRRLPQEANSARKRRYRGLKDSSRKNDPNEINQRVTDGSLEFSDENMENSDYSDEDSNMKDAEIVKDKESGSVVNPATITLVTQPPTTVQTTVNALTVLEPKNVSAKVPVVQNSQVPQERIVPAIQNFQVPRERYFRQLQNEPTPLGASYVIGSQARIALDKVQDAHRSPIIESGKVPVVEIQNMADISNLRVPVRQPYENHQNDVMFIPDASQLELDEYELSEKSSIASRPFFWFIVLLALQGYCFHYYSKPIISSLYEAVGPTVLLYKTLMKIEPKIIENVTVTETFRFIPSPPRKVKKVVEKIIEDEDSRIVDDSEVLTLLEELTSTKNKLLNIIRSSEAMQKVLSDELEIVNEVLQNKSNILESWNAALTQVEEVVNNILDASTEDISIAIRSVEVSPAFDQLRKDALISADFDLIAADIPMWEVASSSGCPHPPLNDIDPFITENDVLQGSTVVKETAVTVVQDVVHNSSLVKHVENWVLDELDKYDLSVNFTGEYDTSEVMKTLLEEEEEEDDMGLVIGLTEDDAKKILRSRLEASLAEFVGLLDVAAKYNGATVIRSGSRATTPSLSQSLPIVNRFMSAAKLRFYGHGPDVALTPTIPADALGQCWSFQDVAMSKNIRWKNVYQRDNSNGKYATLSVKLAKATTVKRVIIEHNSSPEKAESSAIKDFRVFGYQDNQAAGEPSFLGQFRYDKDGSTSQQFFITESHAELQSITLAIDTAYSKDYACLYRFRVLED
jgi:hypothetical protein